MIEKYNSYQFEIQRHERVKNGWVYVIYLPNMKPSKETIFLESGRWYDTAQEARFAAIGHIVSFEEEGIKCL